jgi:hypothetical protein
MPSAAATAASARLKNSSQAENRLKSGAAQLFDLRADQGIDGERRRPTMPIIEGRQMETVRAALRLEHV